MSNHQCLESSKSGFSAVSVQARLSNLLDTQEAQVNNYSTAAHRCTPLTAPKPGTISSQFVNLLHQPFFFFPLNKCKPICIYLCQLGLPEPRLEVTNLTSVFPSRPLTRPVGLTCCPLFRELLPMNYYQRIEAI